MRVELKNLSEILKKSNFDVIAVASSNFLRPPLSDKIGEFTKLEPPDKYKDFGSIYMLSNHPQQVKHTAYFVLPLYKNKPEDLPYLRKCFSNLFEFIKKQQLTTIQLTDASIQYFGYPRENLAEEIVHFADQVKQVPANQINLARS